MPSKSKVRSVLVYLGLGVIALGLTVSAQAAKMSTNAAPSIDGTYKLVYRELPNGTKEMAPNVEGLLTLRNGYRNFNIYWKDEKGNPVSISYVATYKFTPTEYTEKSVYEMMNDGSGKATYDLSGMTGTSKVTMKGARISFKFPNYNEPSVVFEGNTFTATRPGAFVDHWEKVK